MLSTKKKLNSLTFSKDRYRLGTLLLIGILCVFDVAAQTSAFTYQGKLNDGGVPANGTYDIQFRLFDAADAGGQVGSTFTATNVQATAGVFSVSIDFGLAAFPGADRFLEIAISPAGLNNFTSLNPRQKLNSTPYSIQTLNAVNAATALNALSLGGVTANQYVVTGDMRLSDARVPLPGSADYVQNGITVQPGANFSIGGIGSAAILDAANQYNLGGNRFLSAPGTNNMFAGLSAGLNNTTGAGNSFFGTDSGKGNNANFNAFFGAFSGLSNTSGTSNAFFGNSAGSANTTGSSNSFFGQGAGRTNTTGINNVFIGNNAGNPNTTTQVSNSVAIGAGAVVENSHTIVLGTNLQATIARGKLVAGFPTGSGQPFTPGAGWVETWSIQNGPDGIFAGNLVLRSMLNNPTSTAGPICYSNFSFGTTGGIILNRCASTFSSVNDKTDVQPFSVGLELVERLNPVSFKNKAGGSNAIGLNVEDVTEAAPELVIRDEAAMVEKVSENALTVVLINSVKQQQKQIEAQQKQLVEQQRQIAALKDLICRATSLSGVCGVNDK